LFMVALFYCFKKYLREDRLNEQENDSMSVWIVIMRRKESKKTGNSIALLWLSYFSLEKYSFSTEASACDLFSERRLLSPVNNRYKKKNKVVVHLTSRFCKSDNLLISNLKKHRFNFFLSMINKQ
jgi:hypothetical protein